MRPFNIILSFTDSFHSFAKIFICCRFVVCGTGLIISHSKQICSSWPQTILYMKMELHLFVLKSWKHCGKRTHFLSSWCIKMCLQWLIEKGMADHAQFSLLSLSLTLSHMYMDFGKMNDSSFCLYVFICFQWFTFLW